MLRPEYVAYVCFFTLYMQQFLASFDKKSFEYGSFSCVFLSIR